jgi:3-oxoacyl-[acyl-carrier protein] reductase
MNVALVTGGSRGIGRAIVEEFCAAGYAVAFTYLSNRDAADKLVDCLSSRNAAVAAWQADVRDYDRAAEVVQCAQKDLGRIGVLINNAGIKRDGAFTLMDPAAWREVVDTNLTGAFNYSRVLMRSFVRDGGSVVNVASVSARMGLPGQVSYCASKAGLIGFTRALAKEVARFGVRVNAIAPGFIDTDMTGAMDETVRKRLYAQIPMGRPGTARDVARVARFLAEEANYVTGQIWTMDGGLS